jgi:hypothetical protein
MTAPNQSPPSLEELSANKLQELTLSSETAEDDFASLEPRAQRLLFKSMRAEKARLDNIKTQLTRLEQRMPVVDYNQILSTSSRAESFGSKADIDSCGKLWSYTVNPDEDLQGRQPGELTRWNNLQLHFGLHDTTPKICSSKVLPILCEMCEPPRYPAFRYLISSQLLLYRVTEVFGMPPRMTGEFSWAAILYHKDGSSILFCGNVLGDASFDFTGTNAASPDALNLLNFLIQPKSQPTPGESSSATGR